MPPPIHSAIWNYFIPNEHDPERADCMICNKCYSRKGRTTTPLKAHLKSMHPQEYSFFEKLSEEKNLLKMKTEADPIHTPLQEVKEQLSFVEVTLHEEKWDTNNLISDRIDKLIGEMMALQNLPFNFVEGLGFRRLIQELAPWHNLRRSNFFKDTVCKELYDKLAARVSELIEKFDYTSFTSNIWSDPSSNASLLSLTCHGITENFDRSSVVLKCETLDGHHTGDIISETFNTMLSEWSIKEEQVHCVIRNEGPNMKRPMGLGAINYVECPVHKIQLAIHACLNSQENIKTVIQKCKNIAAHFSRSIVAQKQLQEIQDRLNQPHVKLSQDRITRWNSTFYMFERFLKVKDALSIYNNNSDISPISPEEWEIIESCTELLKPFEEATWELSSPHGLISSVIPIIQTLEKTLDDYLTGSHDIHPMRQVGTTLKNELSTKISKLVKNNLYAIATYLDPRYKQKFFTPVTEKKITEDILMMSNTGNDVSDSLNSKGTKRMRMNESRERDAGQLGAGMSGVVRKPHLLNDLAMMLDSSSEDESSETPDNESARDVLKRELLSYRIRKRVNIDGNPLKWWSVHREKLNLLSAIARKVLSPPPASVPREHSFDSAGLIHEPVWNRLDSDKAATLFFIKYNAPIFNFNY